MLFAITLSGCLENQAIVGDDSVKDGCEVLSSVEVAPDSAASFGGTAQEVVPSLSEAAMEVDLASHAGGDPLEDVLSVAFSLADGPVIEEEREQAFGSQPCASGLVRVAPVRVDVAGASLVGEGSGSVVWRGEDDGDAFASFRLNLPTPTQEMQDLAASYSDCTGPTTFAFKSDATADSPWTDPVLTVIFARDTCIGVLYKNR